MNISSLIYIPIIKPNAQIRLICFSYAGGSSSTFLTWNDHLTSDVELAIIQLPGRGVRLFESPYQTMSEIVDAIYMALEKINGIPCIFFGHSMGARVAYELALMLNYRRRGLPIHFVASGSVAPCIKAKQETYNLPDDEFLGKIFRLNGTSKEVFDNQELMQLNLPALRADFKIVETYLSKSRVVLPIPISIFIGDSDYVDDDEIRPWFDLFSYNARVYRISGDHFFVEKNKLETVEALNKIISERLLIKNEDLSAHYHMLR